MSSSTSKLRALTTLLLLGSIAFAVGAAELVLHALDYPPLVSDQSQFLVYDSVRGWRNVADVRKEYVSDEYRHELRYNSLGFRGAPRVVEKPANTVRVLLLGDSFIEGYSVAEQDRVSEVLERRLNAAGLGCRVEVIPLGTAGYSTDQELLWLRQLGLRFRPDITALFFYYNDVWYNAQPTYFDAPKPVFAFAGDSAVLRTPGGRRHVRAAATAAASLKVRTLGWFKTHSRLYRLAERVAKHNPTLRNFAVRLGLTDSPPEMYATAGWMHNIPAEFTVFRADESEAVAKAWQVTDRLLGLMHADVRNAGGDFLVFNIPVRSQVYGHEVTGGVVGAPSAGWDHGKVGRRLLQICVDHGIECIDPTSQYVTAADSLARRQERLYYVMDQHWNKLGHALAAQILADRILRNGRAAAACAKVAVQ